jgi:sugar (pentulose or hexulose) kinase
VPIERVAETELGLRGAAFYALAAIGAYAAVLDVARRLRLSGELYEPNPALAATYGAAADLYRLVRATFRERGLDALLLDGETRVQRAG